MGGFKALRLRPNTKVAVFVFGLVHGFGLATKLQEYSLARNGLVSISSASMAVWRSGSFWR